MATRKNNNKANAEVADVTTDVVVDVNDAVEAVVVDTDVEGVCVASPTGPKAIDVVEANLAKMALIMKETMAAFKVVRKEYAKLTKGQRGKGRKSAAAIAAAGGVPRAPSGFAKPTKLNDELCTFLAIPTGSELARTAVTKLLNGYIMKNKLQNEANKKFILPDDSLRTLLKIGDDVKLSYFNLQKYMAPLYVQ